jgi:hypothetical protein
MGTELRYPNITGTNEREMMVQMKSYLYQLVDQLQYALNNIGASSVAVVTQKPSVVHQTNSGSADPVAMFNDIKSLIIKSADIVNAYYYEITTRLEGKYVAESDFGSFAEQTEQAISQSSTDIEQLFTNLQTIITDIENISFTLAEVNAHIRSGLLYTGDDGIPVYGLEIGQRNSIDGVEVFNKYARFTSDRLSFYDQNDTEVAYISDYKLYIRNVEITLSYKIGGLVDTVMPNGDVVTKWVGGDG